MSEFKPININLGGSNGSNGPKSTTEKIITVVIIIIAIILIFKSPMGDEEYYSGDYAESNNSSSSSQDLLDLLFGGSTQSSTSNVDYSAYEDGTIKNVSEDKYTLMVYMCGSNLESDGGYASSDLEEMLKSSLADEVNLLVYTGGAKRWFDYGISNKTNQIYKIEDHKLNLVATDIGVKAMGNPSTLLEFLNFGKENYPAQKYSLIMWDHGGGAVSGFGLDELANKNDALLIDEMKQALDSFGQKLEFIGFDACLMANLETAYALKNNANYLIASEETEPGTGWNYIKVLNGLSKDSSQDGLTTGKTIVDSFIAINSSFRNPDATLSVVDLSKMDTVYASLVDFMKDVKTNTFDTKKYNLFSRVLATSKAFGEGAIDTVDVIDFATKMNSSKSSGLIDSVKLAVAYNKANQYVENANGMSIFIPNKKLSYYDKMLKIYQNIGMGGEYTNVLSQYANVLAGGKNKTYSVNNKTYTQDTTNYASYTWYDKEVASQSSNLYTLDASKLKVNDKGDYFALQLSKTDWSKVTKVESVIWYDTGKGYVDMGADSYYELDSTGDLKIESDGSWLAINGENVHYEVIERTKNYEKGRVPAVVNNERVNLILYFDKQNPDGEVLGYEPDYEGTSQTLYEKGLRAIKENDKIDFVAPYYTHDGKVQDEFYINDTLVVGSEPLEVSYEDLGGGEILIYYRLTDIYNNIYYTEPVILY